MPCKGCTKRWVDAATGRSCHCDCADYKKITMVNKILVTLDRRKTQLSAAPVDYYLSRSCVGQTKRKAKVKPYLFARSRL